MPSAHGETEKSPWQCTTNCIFMHTVGSRRQASAPGHRPSPSNQMSRHRRSAYIQCCRSVVNHQLNYSPPAPSASTVNAGESTVFAPAGSGTSVQQDGTHGSVATCTRPHAPIPLEFISCPKFVLTLMQCLNHSDEFRATPL